MTEMKRVVALGASNLARGIATIAKLTCAAWGPETQLLAALGYGRSYGSYSKVGFRALPSILKSGLWSTLASMPPVRTKVLVTDVGNDILYGFPVVTILGWVAEAINRFGRITRDITLTSLPLESIRQLSDFKYSVIRAALFPGCKMPLENIIESVGELNTGLEELAAKCNVRLVAPNPLWYGADPIHIRRQFWPLAWSEMLGMKLCPAYHKSNFVLDRIKLSFMAPEQRWLFGVEQFTPQSGHLLSSGARLWLF
jgi:hypothetical protein